MFLWISKFHFFQIFLFLSQDLKYVKECWNDLLETAFGLALVGEGVSSEQLSVKCSLLASVSPYQEYKLMIQAPYPTCIGSLWSAGRSAPLLHPPPSSSTYCSHSPGRSCPPKLPLPIPLILLAFCELCSLCEGGCHKRLLNN